METDHEVAALGAAYQAIKSQPMDAWPRMMQWLNSRLDAEQKTVQSRASLSSADVARHAFIR